MYAKKVDEDYSLWLVPRKRQVTLCHCGEAILAINDDGELEPLYLDHSVPREYVNAAYSAWDKMEKRQ